MVARYCSKPGCGKPAVATLTYDYQDSMAVLGPLSTTPEPHSFDLCEHHAQNMTPPLGWEMVRLQMTFDPAPPSPDDLLALVDAVREAATVEPEPAPRPSRGRSSSELGPFSNAVPDRGESTEEQTESPWARKRSEIRLVADASDTSDDEEFSPDSEAGGPHSSDGSRSNAGPGDA